MSSLEHDGLLLCRAWQFVDFLAGFLNSLSKGIEVRHRDSVYAVLFFAGCQWFVIRVKVFPRNGETCATNHGSDRTSISKGNRRFHVIW